MAGRVKAYLAKRKHKKKMKEMGFPQPSIKERLSERKRKRGAKKAAKFEEKGTRKLTQRGRQKEIGASKKTKVTRGAKSVEKTKGGEYVKYAKKSKSAGKFRSAFKSGCSGGAKSFTWQGRSYSCAKKSDTKKVATKKKEVQGPPVDTSKRGQKRQYGAASRGLHREKSKWWEKLTEENKRKLKKSRKTGKSAY